MTRHPLRAGVVLRAAVMWWLSATPGMASDTPPAVPRQRIVLDLFHSEDKRLAIQLSVPRLQQPRHRLYSELDGARAQARDWLHSAGFSLIEQRDGDGRRSYQVTSGALANDWPCVQLHARVGGPQLFAGLRPRREVPALGLTFPGEGYTLEFEGFKGRGLGTALMARVRRGDAGQRIQYGVGVPLMLGGNHSIGALIQLRVSLGE